MPPHNHEIVLVSSTQTHIQHKSTSHKHCLFICLGFPPFPSPQWLSNGPPPPQSTSQKGHFWVFTLGSPNFPQNQKKPQRTPIPPLP